MKKLLMLAAVLGLVGGIVRAADAPAQPVLKAKVTLAEDGPRLYAKVRLTGIQAKQVLKVHLTWTAPEVYFTPKKGEKVLLFKTSGRLPEGRDWTAGDEVSYCYCSDTNEKGCWRTHANFLIEYQLDNGKTAKAVGTWTVSLVGEDGVALGSATYDVK